MTTRDTPPDLAKAAVMNAFEYIERHAKADAHRQRRICIVLSIVAICLIPRMWAFFAN